MRILHVITRLVHGGAQANTLSTALWHARWGHEVAVATGLEAGPEGQLLDAARASSIPIHPIPALVREPSPARDLRALAQLARLMRSTRWDVIHTHTSKAGFLGRLAARAGPRAAVVHTPHGHIFDAYYGPLRTRFYVQLERFAARLTDVMVALTPRERADTLERRIATAQQFVVVPSGIDRLAFAPRGEAQRKQERARLELAPEAFVIGCVGRLSPVKGQIHLLEALRLMASKLDAARLVLVGDGPERARLERAAAELGIAARVRFTGRVADPAPLYAAFDVVAVPSLNEGMGRVIIEAMAADVAVAASAVGGIPDLVRDGETGLLARARDAEALAAACLRIAADPGLAGRLSARARTEVLPGYDVEAMARRLLEVYEQALVTVRGKRGS